MLRNGLGSIKNLELLLKSIKVGQKGLFAAVAAVHADCAPMIANARGLAESLPGVGADAACAERLADLLTTSLTDLESVLAVAVQSGRLSVAQRLKLERDLSRSARDVAAALPLVGLLDRASRPRPLEPTPMELVHAASAERPEHKGVTAFLSLPASAAGRGASVDLDAAKALVALGVALVMEGDPAGQLQIALAVPAGEAPVTTISLGAGAGLRVRIAALRLLSPSVYCARAAAESLGGRFEYAPEAHRVCIYWPLS